MISIFSNDKKRFKIEDMDFQRKSQEAMIIWVLAKRLNFIGSSDLKQVVAEKANVRLEAATARPVHPRELLLTYGLKQVEEDFSSWIRCLRKLGHYLEEEELNNFLGNLLREEILLRDAYKCYICGVPLSPNIASLHHIFVERKMIQNVPSNLIVLCPNCHKSLGCSEVLS